MLTRFRHMTALVTLGLAASCGGGTDEPVIDNTVASVTVSSSLSTIAPGATVQMTATAKNAAGGGVASPPAATWSSSNQAVATITTSGLVTAVANGQTTITGTIAGVNGTKVISVETVTAVQSATVAAGSNNAFTPPQVDLAVNGIVTWQFNSPVAPHNVTFGASTGAPAGISDTGTGSVSRTFTTPGTYSYTCTNHAGMNGTIVVH
jgi:plastocyanin